MAAFSGAASAQTVTIGVSPGNVFEYSYAFNWESTDPTATIPDEYMEYKNVQLIKLTIKSVSGNVINLDVTKRFKNGTESTQNGGVDLDQQIINAPYGFLIIRANANPKERIYPSGGSATLNETITKSYPIGQIETILYVSVDSSSTSYEKAEIFFDRATGAAAEFQYESREPSGSYKTTIHETLILQRSNVGGKMDFYIYAVFLILIPITLITVFLLMRKRKQNKQKSS